MIASFPLFKPFTDDNLQDRSPMPTFCVFSSYPIFQSSFIELASQIESKKLISLKIFFLSRLLQQNENHNSPLFSARLRLKFYQMLLHIDEFLPRNCHNFTKQLADIFICPFYLLFISGLFFSLCFK